MTSQTSKLFKPIQVGALDLQHRIVLAPLTRGRADSAGVPATYAADYYSQRATRTVSQCLHDWRKYTNYDC